MRVRWAFEEVGRRYDVRLVTFEAMKAPAHLARHPFGQIPTLEDGDLTLFESGVIVLHIAERWPGRLPVDADARAGAIAWMFAALNTVEPPILDRQTAMFLERDKPWFEARLAEVDDRIRVRLDPLSAYPDGGDWLDGAFSAGDLMMVHTLQRLTMSGLSEKYPTLIAYIARAEARPAYRRAFDAQAAVFAMASH
jgi:glutathione S-transferase